MEASGSALLRAVFVLCAVIGFGMHVRAGWSLGVHKWNVDPVSVDEHPERNWDRSQWRQIDPALTSRVRERLP